MMSQPQSGQQQWMWSDYYKQYYCHDHYSNQFVLQNGTRIDVPRQLATEMAERDHQPISNSSISPQSYQRQYRSVSGQTYNASATYGAYTASQHGRQTSWSSSGGESSNEPVTSNLGSMRPNGNGQRRVQRVSFGPVTEVFDPYTNVRTRFQSEPKEEITDGGLFQLGGRAHRMLVPTPNTEETLDKRFKVRDKPSKFFVPGRMFLILWAEPAGDSNQSGVSIPSMISGTLIGSGLYGEPVHQKVRRFVVVRKGDQCCTALPVGTYGGRGVSKYVKKSDHAIIYSSKAPPHPVDEEKPKRGEEGMRPYSIRVVPDEKTEKLDPMSRINFAKPHTIHHNLKVRTFGMVEEKSRGHLLNQFKAVLMEEPSPKMPHEASMLPGDSSNRNTKSASSHNTTLRPLRQSSGHAGIDLQTPRQRVQDAADDSSGDENSTSEDESEEDDGA